MRTELRTMGVTLLVLAAGGLVVIGVGCSPPQGQAAAALKDKDASEPAAEGVALGHPLPERPARAMGVCPPFMLRDEKGNVIDPAKGANADLPYSPKQTCGASGCHDYNLITQGFHFRQGKGETLPKEYAALYNWVTYPGVYGGTWCSPAPLYRQLAPKQNTNARMIDLTSFEFITATCGDCHPGGGPLEYDRDGKRYDEWMRDSASGMTAGGDNGLDGDYYKARWSQTGVIEADCLLCHMPEYDYKKRNAELAKMNFRWAASAGAGFATVQGSVKASETPKVSYRPECFDADGNILVHIVPEPRNETCLNCHAKPGWKKRGAAFSPRTDVHLAAGLRCVDCHAGGSRAADPRIRGWQVHHWGKGDDPAGYVRNDLDNTVRACQDCHLGGWFNAPRATHAWLPPLHLERLACEACHIPTRAVRSALVQASDVYNPAPRILPPPKHIWTFYDQEMNFWNHYGELNLFSQKDQPTNLFRPTLARYKGKIYPVNQVHSTWVGYEEEGKPGLNQLFMKDFFTMWMEHVKDRKSNSPELAAITDDNRDGIIEVNRPEEIDALLTAVRNYLTKTGFPLEGKRLVWVNDHRAYYSAHESRELPRAPHEATAYASVHKYAHDVAPARAALGIGGCTDCHRVGSPFFEGKVLDTVFSAEDAQPRWVPNHTLLGISSSWVRLGAFREEWLKPILYGVLGAVAALVAILVLRGLAVSNSALAPSTARILGWLLVAACALGGWWIAGIPDLMDYMTFRRFTLDANHFWVGLGTVVLGVVVALLASRGPSRASRPLAKALWVLVVLTGACGILMLLKAGWLEQVTRLSYTGFDLGLAAIALVCGLEMLLRLCRLPTARTGSPAAGQNA